MTRTRTLTAAALLGVVVVGAGCSQKYAAERDGKQLGEAICDLRDAETAEGAADALAEINHQLDDLGNKFAMYTAEDRRDIENNLADLAEHAVQDQPNLAYQDLTVLERSADHIAEDLNEAAQAAWDGVQQGLSDCTQ